MELEDLCKKIVKDLSGYTLEIGVFVEDDKREESKNFKTLALTFAKAHFSLFSNVKLGINNAELMYIHENGSEANHIHERPVLEMTIKYANEKLLPKVIDKCIVDYLKSNFDIRVVEKRLNVLAARMETYAQKIIYSNDGRLEPNAPSTIKRKGYNHPLFETGQLAKSITCRVVKR